MAAASVVQLQPIAGRSYSPVTVEENPLQVLPKKLEKHFSRFAYSESSESQIIKGVAQRTAEIYASYLNCCSMMSDAKAFPLKAEIASFKDAVEKHVIQKLTKAEGKFLKVELVVQGKLPHSALENLLKEAGITMAKYDVTAFFPPSSSTVIWNYESIGKIEVNITA